MLEPQVRSLLGEFVRARRERLPPDRDGGRRRTPGLRREEAAARAGISTTWWAWIEQGRDVRPSPEALARIAAVFGLTPAERAYLFELAGRFDPSPAQNLIARPPAALAAAVEALHVPAYGLDRLWNACCWNAAAKRLFAGWIDGAGDRNLIRFVFLDPAARRLIPDWEGRARRLLAEFRADFGHMLHDPEMRSFAHTMRSESAFFAQAWDDQGVQFRVGGMRNFNHPQDGPITFVQHSFSPSGQRDFKLVMLVPAAGRDGEIT